MLLRKGMKMFSLMNIAKAFGMSLLKVKGLAILLTSGWKKILFVIGWMLFMRFCPWDRVKWGMEKVDKVFHIT